jgi:hypothetical protein
MAEKEEAADALVADDFCAIGLPTDPEDGCLLK